MADKEYVCAYGKHCLHPDSKVSASESVIISGKHYHWDCAAKKQEVKECVDTYMEYIEDKTQYPMAFRIINTLVFNNKVPTEFILKNVKKSKKYYTEKPVQVLYGLRKLFWEKEFKA